MGVYTILKNSTLNIQLRSDYQDNGWSVVGGNILHDKCNSGEIENTVFRPKINVTYTINFTVSSLTGGTVKVYFGGKLIREISNSGNYSIDVLTIDSKGLSFWSDADVIISNPVITEGVNSGKTLLFNEDNNKFVGYRSYSPDFMTKFIDEFVTFKDGSLWVHDKNEVRGSFYGVQYPSEITFYVNVESDKDKDFYSMKIQGSEPWSVTVETHPIDGKPRGQRSRIKKGNFTSFKGTYVAEFLRDMNDPRFSDELQALMRGAYLQGKLMKVTLRNDSTHEVKLLAIEVEVSIK